jgi:hypothetical protein
MVMETELNLVAVSAENGARISKEMAGAGATKASPMFNRLPGAMLLLGHSHH